MEKLYACIDVARQIDALTRTDRSGSVNCEYVCVGRAIRRQETKNLHPDSFKGHADEEDYRVTRLMQIMTPHLLPRELQ